MQREPLFHTRDLLYALYLIDVWRITGLKSSPLEQPWRRWRRRRQHRQWWAITSAAVRWLITRVSDGFSCLLCYSLRAELPHEFLCYISCLEPLCNLALFVYRVWPELQPNCTGKKSGIDRCSVYRRPVVMGNPQIWIRRHTHTKITFQFHNMDRVDS